MPSIRSDNKIHEQSCAVAESNRQAAVAAAGSSAAAVKAADVAFYRAVVASTKSNGLPYGHFLFALHSLNDDAPV